MNRLHPAAAGAVAALCWAALEPLDRRLFGHDYSDVALLGKAVTRSRAWPVAGLAIHAVNGAIFGEVLQAVQRWRYVDAKTLALVEHLTLFPLGYLVDRKHPARGEPGLASLFSLPAFAQATVRHAIFGATLDLLRENPGRAE